MCDLHHLDLRGVEFLLSCEIEALGYGTPLITFKTSLQVFSCFWHAFAVRSGRSVRATTSVTSESDLAARLYRRSLCALTPASDKCVMTAIALSPDDPAQLLES